MIHKAGGLAVIAHPGLLPLNDSELNSLLVDFKSKGLDGVEVLYTNHEPILAELLAKMAATLGLLITGGSHFHGEAKPDTALGTGRRDNLLQIPYSLVEKMKAALKA